MPTTQDPTTQTDPQGQQPVTNGGGDPAVQSPQPLKTDEPNLDINFDLDFSQNDPSMGGMPINTTQTNIPIPEQVQVPTVETANAPGTSLEEPNLDINFDIEPDLTVENTTVTDSVQTQVSQPVQPQVSQPVQSKPIENNETVVAPSEEPNLDINFDVEPDLTVEDNVVSEPVQSQVTDPKPTQAESTQNMAEEITPVVTEEPTLDVNFDEGNEDEDTESVEVVGSVNSVGKEEDDDFDDNDSDDFDDNDSDEDATDLSYDDDSNNTDSYDYDDEDGVFASYSRCVDLYQKIVSITGESQYQMTHSESGTNYNLTKIEDGLTITRTDDSGTKTLSFDDSMGLIVNYNTEEILDFDEGDDEDQEEVVIVKNKLDQFAKELDMNYQTLKEENEGNKKGELLEEVKNF